ncbi:MAG: YHS domain-containing (seleno)protein [Bacteroidia bacterium]
MKNINQFTLQFAITFLFFLSASFLFAQDNNSSKRIANYNIEKGLAIQGYDPVSYFTSSKAIKGSKENSYVNNGVTYYFSSKVNLDLFKSNPAKYEPQYGGWCAYAMGNDGTKVEVDPETFKIVNGKLYLFYNFYFTNTLKKWNANESVLNKNADLNWNKIINK